jgi:hypothetical protein
VTGKIKVVNRPLATDDLININVDHFLSIGFTHHYEILVKAKTLEERLFYIENCATSFWSVEKLKYNFKASLFQKQGSLLNNFEKTIQNRTLQKQALQQTFDTPSDWQSKSVELSPLITDFPALWDKLKDTYRNGLSQLAFSTIPDEKDVEESFMEVIKSI